MFNYQFKTSSIISHIPIGLIKCITFQLKKVVHEKSSTVIILKIKPKRNLTLINQYQNLPNSDMDSDDSPIAIDFNLFGTILWKAITVTIVMIDYVCKWEIFGKKHEGWIGETKFSYILKEICIHWALHQTSEKI